MYNIHVYNFVRGQIVHILDRPFGHPTKSLGRVVGILSGESYNVFITTGLNEGSIKKFKYYHLRKKEADEAGLPEREVGSEDHDDNNGQVQ